MAKISFGEPDTTWEQYGLTENPIQYNQQSSGYKAIVRDDELVTIVTNRYQLLPNQKALEIAEEAAELCNLEPFTPSGRKNNRIYNKHNTRMHAWFAPPEDTYKIGGETVHIGVDVRNSIDSSMSFGCGVFTYRAMCANGVILGKHQMASYTHLHTKGLKPVIGNLKNRMVQVMEHADEIAEAYREMTRIHLTEELIEKIQDSTIPQKVMPPYLEVDDGQQFLGEPTELTEWDAYNDLTEAIWHNADTDISTKRSQFRALHKVIPVVVRQ